MYYFAYGSNMSIRRLQARTPSARKLANAMLRRHRLCFHKVSRKDGSAKCDVYMTRDAAHRVEGVLFELPAVEKPALDRAEGLGQGYAIKTVRVELNDGYEVAAFTYYATLIDATLKPFHWYKEHVLRGALENRLSAAYIRSIGTIDSIEDPDIQRHARELAIYRN